LLHTAAAVDEGKGRLSNNIYTIPGVPHQVSIRDTGYYCVREVLSRIEGGRAKIKDVIDKINKIFLEHNPDGWQTKNKQKRAGDGGFTTSALRRVGKAAPPAAPGRWAMKPTFRVDDDDADELVLIRDASVKVPRSAHDARDARDDDDDEDDAADSGDAAAGDDGGDDMSDIDG
jgi:hypothetical protein